MIFFRWYFAVISVSGVFAVTFSVVFAYVADITQEHERSMAYGLVCIFFLTLSVSVVNTSALNTSVRKGFQNLYFCFFPGKSGSVWSRVFLIACSCYPVLEHLLNILLLT